MKNKIIKPIRLLLDHKSFFLCAAVMIACALLCLPFLTAYTQPLYSGITDLAIEEQDMNGWEVYVIEGGKRIPLVHNGFGIFYGLSYPGQTFYASRVMEETYEDAVLQIEGAFAVSIFLDGKLLYTDEVEAGTEMDSLNFSGTFTEHMLPSLLTLPPDYPGKTLTIAQAQPGSEKQEDDGMVYFAPVTLYSGTALQSVYAAQATEAAYPAMLLAIIGAALSGLFLFQTFRQKSDWGILFLSMFSFAWMVDVLLRSQLSFYYYGLTIAQLQQYLYFACFIFLSLFLFSRMERCRKFFLPFILAQAVSIAISAIAQNALEYGDLSLFLTALPQLVVFISVIAGICFAIMEARFKTWFFRLFNRLLLVAVCIFAAIYLVSVVSKTTFFTEFNENIVAAFRTGLFYYPLVLLRYMLILACFIAVVAEFVRLVAQRNTDLRLMEQKSRMTKESYDQLNRYTEQTMTLRHDLKKHLTVVDFYLQEGNIRKAHEYLQKVNMSMDRVAHISNTGNELIDVIVSSKLAEAEQNGISTKITCAAIPEALPFSDTDLSSLLMNSLDNALAAAKCVLPNPFIEVDIHIKSGFLYYSCKNAAKKPSVPHSNTKNNPMHGYGLPIMEQIVEKNRGIMNMEYTEDTFRLNIALPITDAHLER